MTDADKDAHAATKAVALEYDLPHAPEKVWRALADPDLLAAWLLPVTDARRKAGRPAEDASSHEYWRANHAANESTG